MTTPATRTSRSPVARRVTAVVAGCLGAALALTGCTPAAPEADAEVDYELTAQTDAPSGDIDSFSWVSYAEPYSLDYAYAFDYADNQVLANVCESLLRLNPDYTLTPALAESFAHPTPTTWVYTIRDGVTFHDGTPLTAADVVASMQRHLDPEVGSSWYSVYQNVTSIEQTGEREVTVTEASPDSQFNLAMGGVCLPLLEHEVPEPDERRYVVGPKRERAFEVRGRPFRVAFHAGQVPQVVRPAWLVLVERHRLQ